MSYHLFEVFGIELEYMLVNSDSLKITPIVDELLTAKNGSLTSDIDNGAIEWSNELVAHVIELKTNSPTSDLENLDTYFAENIREINTLLKPMNAVLWPTASHPLMQPKEEMKLWQHNYSQIYALYNRIFDCTGHGWSNVQSMHINLPFYDDSEFEKLHAAIRILMPIIPALSASSPIFEGQYSGIRDLRMEVYKTNQKEIPEMTGRLIPEAVFNREDYFKTIFEPINKAIKPFDTENILDHHFLNSRGAIARFDRNAIEIRVIDLQECPKADIAIAVLIVEALKLLVSEEWITLKDQKSWHEEDLLTIFNISVKNAEEGVIDNIKYLDIFDIKETSKAGHIWKKIYGRVKEQISAKHQATIEIIFKNGSLSSRILKAVNEDFSEDHLKEIYSELGDCLQNNELFIP